MFPYRNTTKISQFPQDRKLMLEIWRYISGEKSYQKIQSMCKLFPQMLSLLQTQSWHSWCKDGSWAFNFHGPSINIFNWYGKIFNQLH